jgi:hypothetical protein
MLPKSTQNNLENDQFERVAFLKTLSKPALNF